MYLATVQELIHILSWAHGVVPTTEDIVPNEVNLAHFGLRDFGSGFVELVDQIAVDDQTGFGFCSADELENLLDVGERFARPVLADVAE